MGDPTASGQTRPDVELVFNCFERTIGLVTGSPMLAELAAAQSFPFCRRTLLVNNVADVAAWRDRLDALVAAGSVDRWLTVEEALPRALELTGLRPAQIEPRGHWTDFALVAVTLPEAPMVCYCDPEIEMATPGDWVGPALELMARDPRVAVANPRWTDTTEVEERADEVSGEFLVGYGFTDHVFLVRRGEFGRPIYSSRVPMALRCPASLRYPTALDSEIFEQRVDAYMRGHRRMRATHRHVAYHHHGAAGSDYSPRSIRGRAVRWRNRAILKVLVEGRFRSPRLRVTGRLAPGPGAHEARDGHFRHF